MNFFKKNKRTWKRYFRLGDELFAKILGSLATCQSVNNNFCII